MRIVKEAIVFTCGAYIQFCSKKSRGVSEKRSLKFSEKSRHVQN